MATLTTSQIGADKQYTSAAAWESGEQRDLIAADEQETATIDGGYDAGPVTMAGWGSTTTGTDATRYPKITSAVSHEGVFTADGGLSGYLSGKSVPNQNFATLENVEVIQNDSDKAIEYTLAGNTFRLYNVLVDSPGTVANYAIHQTQNTAAADCRNCCIRSADGGIRFGDNLTTIVESTTVIAGGVGGNYAFFRGILTDCTGYNSVSGLAFRFPEVGSDYCAGSDTTTPGSNSVDNINTDVFENYAGGDYTPAAGELLDSAITPGANLSADFTDDITGYTRPGLPDPWCIGAYEIQGGGAVVQWDGPSIIDQDGVENDFFLFDDDGAGNVASRFSGTGAPFVYAVSPISQPFPQGVQVNGVTGNPFGRPIEDGTFLGLVISAGEDEPAELFTDIATISNATWDDTTLTLNGSNATAQLIGTPVNDTDYHYVFDYDVPDGTICYLRFGGGANQAFITGPAAGTFNAVYPATGTDYLMQIATDTGGPATFSNFSVKEYSESAGSANTNAFTMTIAAPPVFDVAFDSGISVAAAAYNTADVLADITAGAAFGDSLQVVTVVEAVISETTGLGGTVTGDVDAGGDVFATVTYGLNASVNKTAEATAFAELIVSAGLGSAFTGEVEAAGDIQATFTTTTAHGTQVSAQAESIAAIEIDQALAVSVIAEAITDAGFEVGHLVDVTFTGSKISGQMVTPDCRTFVVQAEIRSFKVTC